MNWRYDKLRGKIKEVCGTQDMFAEKLGIGRVSLSQRLNNQLEFSQDEIFKSCEILRISSFSSISERILSSDDCFKMTRISSKSRHTSPISFFGTFGISKSKLPYFIFCVASFNLSSGFIIER